MLRAMADDATSFFDGAQRRAARWLAMWDAQGIHRTATAGDEAGADWLAGEAVALEASTGRSLAADFDGQVREVFARLGRTLAEAGASLADMVTMTVFITDARYGDRFTQLRREIFRDDFPASALITVAGLARPEFLVEVQGIAVIG